jgi:hypothetical protein
MAVATGVNLTASLTGIVDDIRVRSYKYIGQEGVFKALVTPIGEGAPGYAVTEPYWDPTVAGQAVTVASEGVDFTAFTSYVPSTRTYTATEQIKGTLLTDRNIKEAKESIRDEQARMHSYVHAHALEVKCAAVCASFTSTLTATGTAGLTIAKTAIAKATLEDKVTSFPGPYSLVVDAAGSLQLFTSLTNVSNVGVLGTLGDKTLDKYHVNTVLGDINVFQSNGFATSATSYHLCGLFVKQAIGLFVPEDFSLKTQENISLRAVELVSTMRAGARVRLAAAGVTIKVTKAVA